jgi:hypothetical protein
MTRLAALVFAVTAGLTTALMVDPNTSFCNVSQTTVGFLACHLQHGALARIRRLP